MTVTDIWFTLTSVQTLSWALILSLILLVAMFQTAMTLLLLIAMVA